MSQLVKMTTLRIRNNGTIRELNIPKDKLEQRQKIVSSPKTMDRYKRYEIRKLTGGSPCCMCDGLPSLEVIYQVPDGGATQLERYCNRCIERVYSREEVL